MPRDTKIERLEEALARLAEAQAPTERAMRALAEAQSEALARADRLEDALARLAEAQARTEARVEQLAEAQARTEARVAQLVEAQARTEARVEQLAVAVAELTRQVGDLAQQVGRLSDTVGFTLEDLAREVSPAYLAQHYGIHVAQLERRFFSVDGREIEVDFYGEGRRDGQTLTIVGEVRSRIYGADVEAAVRQAGQLAAQLPATPITVVFGFVIHPSAREAAERHGAIVISSSGR